MNAIRCSHSAGFTLVEAIMVIVITGVIAGMVAVYDVLALAWQALAETAAGIPGAGRAN